MHVTLFDPASPASRVPHFRIYCNPMHNTPIQEPAMTKRERREQRRQQEMFGQQQQKRKQSARAVALWTTIAIIGVSGIYGLVKISRSASQGSDRGTTVAPVSGSDWTRGPENASVTLVEYGDFQCPACAVYFPVVEQLLENNPDTVRFAFRQYPLRTIHTNADAAARASEAAGTLGAFWPMYDKLYSEQDAWSDVDDAMTLFQTYATELGLDAGAWRSATDSAEVKQAIQDDLESGDAAGVDGTPSFFVNNRRIANPASLDAFQKVIDDAKKNAVAAPVQEHFHGHADLLVQVNGRIVDFSAAKYQSTKDKELDPSVHLHSGNGRMIHMHEADVTLEQLMTSLGMQLTNDCLTLDDGTAYCTDETNVLKLLVHRAADQSDQFSVQERPAEHVLQDLDRIVLLYERTDDADSINTAVRAVGDEACIYSETCPQRGKPPAEECVGGLGSDCNE